MNRKLLFIISFTCLTSFCYADEPPVEVQLTHPVVLFGVPVPSLKITALANEIEIEDVIINRGNCQLTKDEFGSAKGLPASLVYGESVQLYVLVKERACTVREVAIETSEGSPVFEFLPNR